MALKIIVSYDDTANDRDALALGRLLAFSGAELSLAYVRHSLGGALEEKEAEQMLARGAASVGAPDMPRHVVINPGTSVGLAELAEREDADVIVFGSEYRTARGTVKPGIAGKTRPPKFTHPAGADTVASEVTRVGGGKDGVGGAAVIAAGRGGESGSPQPALGARALS